MVKVYFYLGKYPYYESICVILSFLGYCLCYFGKS